MAQGSKKSFPQVFISESQIHSAWLLTRRNKSKMVTSCEPPSTFNSRFSLGKGHKCNYFQLSLLASAVSGNIQAGWIRFLTRLRTDLDSFLEIQDILFLKLLNFSHPSLIENIIYPITACGKRGEGEADGIWIQDKNYSVSLLFSSITDDNFHVI